MSTESMSALASVREARRHLENACELLDPEDPLAPTLALALDGALEAVDAYLSAVEEAPAKLHTIVGLGREKSTGSWKSAAFCSCGWDCAGTPAQVGNAVTLHLIDTPSTTTAERWTNRARLPFAGRWDV